MKFFTLSEIGKVNLLSILNWLDSKDSNNKMQYTCLQNFQNLLMNVH